MNDREAREKLAQMTAMFDQAKASMGEMAGMIVAYRAALLAGGISEADALQLTLNLQAMVLANAFGAAGQ